MTKTSQTPALMDHGQARHHLEALHFHGFTVTIHSPKTSPDRRLYCVTAYGSSGQRTEMLTGRGLHLDAAVRAAALKLGAARLDAYVAHLAEQEARS